MTEAACWGEPRRASKSLVLALGIETVECVWGLGLGKKSDVDEAVAAREKERTTANLSDRNGGLPIIKDDKSDGKLLAVSVSFFNRSTQRGRGTARSSYDEGGVTVVVMVAEICSAIHILTRENGYDH